METHNGIKAFHARTVKAWRKWLEKNHNKETCVWLIIYHKASKTPSVYYNEAVEQSLCFGWIDSKPNKRDSESYYLYFAKRKPGSNWSKINRERAGKLIAKGLMTAAGQEMIDIAKTSGTWTVLDRSGNIILPDDLQKRLAQNKTALKNFSLFSPSSKKIIIEWILSAKRRETRQERVKQTVVLASKNIRANHYVKP
ncbi:MAG: YdeI/OmpD-associated family protein [Parafilimonas sp.]|nr:YdeI/OmpD-associated family protein [Parafilimonas sp.]